jgi:hypothetical protein
MSEDLTIFRKSTSDEKQDFIEIKHGGTRDLLDAFLEELAKKQQEFQKKYLPFDMYSARIDFEESIRKTFGEATASLDEDKKIRLPKLNLDKYGEASRFILLDIVPTYEDKLMDGIRNTVVTGIEFRYKAKQRGNGVTIFVPRLVVDRIKKQVKEMFGDPTEPSAESELLAEEPIKEKSKV